MNTNMSLCFLFLRGTAMTLDTLNWLSLEDVTTHTENWLVYWARLSDQDAFSLSHGESLKHTHTPSLSLVRHMISLTHTRTNTAPSLALHSGRLYLICGRVVWYYQNEILMAMTGILTTGGFEPVAVGTASVHGPPALPTEPPIREGESN